MLNDGKAGREGRLEKFGISICLEIPKFLIWGMEKPSKLSKPVNGDCRASLGFNSDDELEPSEEDEGEDDDDTGEEIGEDSWLLDNRLSSKFALI